MKQVEQTKDMLKILEELTKRVENNEITDLVVLGYGSGRRYGGVLADQITAPGLLKCLENEVSAKFDTPVVNTGFKQFMKDLLKEDEY